MAEPGRGPDREQGIGRQSRDIVRGRSRAVGIDVGGLATLTGLSGRHMLRVLGGAGGGPSTLAPRSLAGVALVVANVAEQPRQSSTPAGWRAMNDEHRRHRLSFGSGVMLAALFVALDALPANLAAQTFGLDPLPTWGITAVIVGALRVSSAETRAMRLRRRVEKLTAQESTLAKRLDASKTEFIADARLFSFRTFQNDARRNQFLDHVRTELDR